MKKQLIIFACLLFSMVVLAQKKNYNIGILLDEKTKVVEPVLLELQHQITAVVGEDAIINFPSENILVNNFDLKTAEQNYNTLLNNNTDIILAFGVANNKILSNRSSYPKPTILFGAVNKDFSDIDFTKNTSGITNFTSLVESKSFLEDFKVFKELVEFKKLGIAVESHQVELLSLEEAFEKTFDELGVDYKLIPFKTISDIEPELNDIDAVYLAGGFLLGEDEMTEVADLFIEKKLPSFTSLGVKLVENGVMATNQAETNIDQYFRRIALTIEGYVNGTDLADMPVFIDSSPKLTINYRTAEKVNVPIKYSLISNINFVANKQGEPTRKKYTILEILDQLLEQNLNLKSQEKEVEITSQDVKIAKSDYMPSLTAAGAGTYIDPNFAENSIGLNPEFSITGNLSLQQTIFSEAANANISIRKRLQEAQQEVFNASQLDIIFQGSNAYFNILILKANVQIQMRNLELTRENLKIAEQNYEAGQSGKSDLLRFKSQMAQDTQTFVEAVNQLEQGFIALNQILNNPLDTKIDIENATLEDNVFKDFKYEQLVNLLDNPATTDVFVNFLVEEAKNNAPELKSLDYNLQAVDRSLRLNSGGRLLPTIALQGQYNRIFDRRGAGSEPAFGLTQLDENYNVGLNISIPIINRNLNNINRQRDIIQKEQLNFDIENSELAIDSNVRAAVLNIINEISNIELSKVAEAAAKEALSLTQNSYSNGAVSIIQLIDAQNNLLNAQIASTNAVYNFLINSIQLERFLGYYFLLNSEEDNDKFIQRFFEYLNDRD